MATGHIFNAYGDYDERDGVKGVELSFTGHPFFMPYRQVTYIPDWEFAEVDQDKSTASVGEFKPLSYVGTRLKGQRIVEELTAQQIPYPNRAMGLLPIKGVPTGKTLKVKAGEDAAEKTALIAMGASSADAALTVEVAEIEPTLAEIAEAERLAKSYKEIMISNYFQSKRQRMSGGQGQLQPSPRVAAYMAELGVADIDDVQNHAIRNAGAIDPQAMAVAMASALAILENQRREDAARKETAEAAMELATRP